MCLSKVNLSMCDKKIICNLLSTKKKYIDYENLASKYTLN